MWAEKFKAILTCQNENLSCNGEVVGRYRQSLAHFKSPLQSFLDWQFPYKSQSLQHAYHLSKKAAAGTRRREAQSQAKTLLSIFNV